MKKKKKEKEIRIKDNQKRYYANHRNDVMELAKKWRNNNREQFHIIQARSRKKRLDELKHIVYEHYGGKKPKCTCCGEMTIKLLTIDHINNNGNGQRKQNIKGLRFYRWIVQNDFPSDLQLLCWNCNMGKAREDDHICPHKKENTW